MKFSGLVVAEMGGGIRKEEIDGNWPLIQRVKSFVGSAKHPRVYLPEKGADEECFNREV